MTGPWQVRTSKVLHWRYKITFLFLTPPLPRLPLMSSLLRPPHHRLAPRPHRHSSGPECVNPVVRFLCEVTSRSRSSLLLDRFPLWATHALVPHTLDCTFNSQYVSYIRIQSFSSLTHAIRDVQCSVWMLTWIATLTPIKTSPVTALLAAPT